MAMRSYPPSGPRAGRSSGPGRFSHRGGVQKRSQQSGRVDRDGDLDMDSNGAGRGRGRGRGDRRRHTPTPQMNGHGNPFNNTQRNKVDLSNVQKGIFQAMGVKGSVPRGRGTSSRFGKSGPGRNNLPSGGLDQIVIRGLEQSKAAANADGGLEALITWLERKATSPQGEMVKVKKSRRNGNDVVISVRPEDTASIVRLNNYQFAGANMTVELHQHGRPPTNNNNASSNNISAEATEVKSLLSGVLFSRYNQDLRLLDLSRLGEDPELANSGLLDSNSRISMLFPALMEVCDEAFENPQKKTEAVVSVSLANNNLINLDHVFKLAVTFPTIKNLDLSNNQFKNLAALEKWRFKFPHLEHLVVSGNPLENNDPTFMASLMARYPKLQKLETTPGLPTNPVQTRRSSGINMPVAPPSFRDDADISKNFIISFFPSFDTDRNLLLNNFYDNYSLFSVNVNTQAPREQTTSTPPATWDQYIKGSRNLLKINHTKARMNRLAKGREKIRTLWNTFPATRHADLNAEPEKWCIECHSIVAVPDQQMLAGVGGLIITTHGEYTEQDGAKRSFDRTFVLGPGSGSGGIRVVSDMLTVRAYGGYEVWVPNTTNGTHPTSAIQIPQPNPAIQMNQNLPSYTQLSPFAPQPPVQLNPLQTNPLQVQPSFPQTQSSPPQPVPDLPPGFGRATEGKTEEQLNKETLAMELTSRTHMTIHYSGICLDESGWDLETAYRAFEAAKSNLPAEAFLPF